VLAKLKNAEGLDQSYDGAKTKFLEQMQELTPEYKRQWFA
jgi:hypothetical protein